MSRITDIKQQKRTEGRYSIYIDGKYEFGLSDLDLSTSGLRIGQELTAEEVQVFCQQASNSKAYALAIRFIALRMRSRQEVEEYLGRKGYDSEEVQSVIERLGRARLLDDQAFARAWVANRQLLSPRSRRRLIQELQAKGVDRADIVEALDEAGDEAELEAVLTVAQKKRRLSQYQDSDKLMGYLARQGYPYELIKKALLRLDEQD